MYPLSCAHVHAHTGHETSAHKKTWSTLKSFFQKCFCTYFIHVIPNSDEFRKSVAQQKFYACTDFKKLDGTYIIFVICDI